MLKSHKKTKKEKRRNKSHPAPLKRTIMPGTFREQELQ